ncbi:Glycine dehydrogenase [decarboxylating] (glycine cleavage system P2 protein) [Candidatus Syntrophocurvum alkaliphilum]|uniref:Probable glycine dehydrogenase (decarboxylating) subunit 2 n=1 Tax=Candidatus Syntrophocurvum alkaliphilum TaxID=2293317 RepID=A0A6I6D6Q2_9FIRM|nr:aminomethyl-transferring glycine dehydrogenase subunit GcvPB [Candidatus Syntrophocurvum alkaliphilum]QGT98883.1 Glycine dehydrogenase [decarboxylating] (glycine cleavage system P2 protein) [Candidatus Syntrophocurvum alkaliphilum]
MARLIFEKSVAGSNKFKLPSSEVNEVALENNIPANFLRNEDFILPDISEVETIRHFTDLSTKAFGVDTGMYPLGSCTMKYNNKVGEWSARLPGFTNVHPYQPEETVQGALELMYELERMLCEIGGMDHFSLQPAAGAHGEMAGIVMIKAYHNNKGDTKRTKMLVPDSAHGTNPATANVVGYDTIEIKSNEKGMVDIEDLRSKMSDEVAGIMLTNPNTLGLFEEDIVEIAQIVHDGGGLLYYDGANLNGIMGVSRPGDMGFDIVHYNLHKTFGTPHGGGGPGSGPVGVKAFLADYLPVPMIEKKGDQYSFNYDIPNSIGKVKNFYGNFGVMVKAYTYIRALGKDGLREACEHAVLNANYLMHHLKDTYHIPFDRVCKHEFIATSKHQVDKNGVTTLDVAKRLLDYKYHPPTVYFPLIVKEALMIEPTETESQERLDSFIDSLKRIAKEAEENPELVTTSPHEAVVGRLDEVTAARSPKVKWEAT